MFYETTFQSVYQADLKWVIILPHFLRCWDWRHMLLYVPHFISRKHSYLIKVKCVHFCPAHVFILCICNSTTAAKYFSTPKNQVPFQFSTGQLRNPPGNSPFSTGCFILGATQTCEKLQDSTASLPHWLFVATLTSFFPLLIPYSISYIPASLLKQDKFISIKLQAC